MAGAALFILLGAAGTAQGQDLAGSADHPVITRYPGMTITRYEVTEFGRYNLVYGVDRGGNPADIHELEGKVTRLTYKNPAGRSTLEIMSNFQEALKKSGAQILFSCEAAACGNTTRWTPVNGIRAMGRMLDNKYVSARAKRSEVQVNLSIFVGRYSTQLDVIEVKEMESGLVTVDAEAMAEGIDRDGHIAIYEILFDTGKATLKPESKVAIGEISSLLKENPSLQLHVVGHTDNTGELEFNMKLSMERAQAVMQALVKEYQVAASRLQAHGVGPLAPVASNETEEGKTKNRRVDLVKQ
jgi:outer membrane protein OmpA-like peptidoglycan-associated protein